MAAAAADSRLVALHHIKKEPGQEPEAANRHDEQHAVAAKDSDQAVVDLAALEEEGETHSQITRSYRNFPKHASA